MAILLYCVAEASQPLKCPDAGVGGLAVSRVEHSGLAIFVSEDAGSDAWSRTPARDSALQFHQVLRRLFGVTAILPFRFPTILADNGELARHVESSSGRYHDLLQKYKTSVQMEVHVSGPEKSASGTAASGTEYLHERKHRVEALDALVARLRSAAGSVVKDSCLHFHGVPNGGIRWFARLERDSIEQFNKSMRTLMLPAGYTARVSGPWPVTEFFDSRV